MQQWLELFNERQPTTARATRTVRRWWLKIAKPASLRWLLALVLGLGFGLIGPYGTYFTYGLALRLAYWIAVTLAGFLAWAVLEQAVARFAPAVPAALRGVLVTIPFALVNSAVIVGVHHVMLALGGPLVPVTWSSLVSSHVVLSTLVILPAIHLVGKLKLRVETAAGSDAIHFLTEKLPGNLKGTRPFALAAEGHYVWVHTALGKELVTMKFEDAVRAVVGIEGLRTHRSWWVALDQIADVRSVGSACEAVLQTGLVVPVSRRRKSALRAAIEAQGMR
ncbi:MAG: LytTR family DNA-binding domain-containing protein [Pseudomonadota bacterium]